MSLFHKYLYEYFYKEAKRSFTPFAIQKWMTTITSKWKDKPVYNNYTNFTKTFKKSSEIFKNIQLPQKNRSRLESNF